MKAYLILLLTTVFSFFAPISFTIVVLMGMILIDTIVKLFSLRTLAKSQNRKYLDVFESEILRKRFILKSLGYLLLCLPVSALDIFAITPSINWFLSTSFDITIPTKAVTSNILILLFCFMELSSINENWNTLTGNDLFKAVIKATKKVRTIISYVIDVKNIIKK